MISPVSHPASSEARNTATRAMSSGWPTRPNGVPALICFLNSGFMTPAACAPSVSVPPRAIVSPLYEALNEPAKKDVSALLAKAAHPDYRSYHTNEEFLTREQ